MACGCKRGVRNSRSPRTVATVNQRVAVSQNSNLVSAQNVMEVKALNSKVPRPPRSPAGLNAERRKIERIRRNAIRRALGKG